MIQLLLDELNHLVRSRVVVARPEARGKAVRVARFLQKFTCLFGVVGRNAEARRTGNLGRNDAGRRLRKAVVGHLAERLAIDRIAHRLTHAHVVERLLHAVDREIAHHDRGHDVDVEIGIFLQFLHLLDRHRMNKVRLARAQHRRARRIFHYRHPGDGIELREPRHAVVGVLHHNEPFARVVVLQRIGTGAAGIKGNAAAVVLLER